MAGTNENDNFEIFRDCVSEIIARALATGEASNANGREAGHASSKAAKKRKASKEVDAGVNASDGNNAVDGDGVEELTDFIEYIAEEIFTCLPTNLQELSYSSIRNDAVLAEEYSLPLTMSFLDDLVAKYITPSVVDSLSTYGLLSLPEIDVSNFLLPILTSYITITTIPPPSLLPSGARSSACEICSRDWVPLTYHHLIPKSTHAKVIKRGWHEEWRLNSVAWLCRACHSTVHGIADNEELARHWYTVELLLGREDIQKWAAWIGRVRWKSK